jgi:hypothetical protein
MVGPFPGVPYSFGALRQTYGPLFVRCDVWRRCARLYLAEIRDTDYRTETFSCCRCGTDGALAIAEPNTETGMTDYQLDQVEGSQHHPAAFARLARRRSVSELIGNPDPSGRLTASNLVHYRSLE